MGIFILERQGLYIESVHRVLHKVSIWPLCVECIYVYYLQYLTDDRLNIHVVNPTGPITFAGDLTEYLYGRETDVSTSLLLGFNNWNEKLVILTRFL